MCHTTTWVEGTGSLTTDNIDATEVDRDGREGHVVPGAWRAQARGMRDAGRMAANTCTRADHGIGSYQLR